MYVNKMINFNFTTSQPGGIVHDTDDMHIRERLFTYQSDYILNTY